MSTIQVISISSLHQDCILRWKKTKVVTCQQPAGLLQLVEENHGFNYQLWHAEDRARRDDQGYEYVYQAKREIDACNQQRNNRMEAMDEWLFNELKPADAAGCPVHSETPGMIIDRLSILALKAYHMQLQINRADVNESHRQQCRQKFAIISQQQQQLTNCLELFLKEIVNQTRTFRVYHQFKMYNDPNLNPELYEKL